MNTPTLPFSEKVARMLTFVHLLAHRWSVITGFQNPLEVERELAKEHDDRKDWILRAIKGFLFSVVLVLMLSILSPLRYGWLLGIATTLIFVTSVWMAARAHRAVDPEKIRIVKMYERDRREFLTDHGLEGKKILDFKNFPAVERHVAWIHQQMLAVAWRRAFNPLSVEVAVYTLHARAWLQESARKFGFEDPVQSLYVIKLETIEAASAA